MKNNLSCNSFSIIEKEFKHKVIHRPIDPQRKLPLFHEKINGAWNTVYVSYSFWKKVRVSNSVR